MAEYSGKTHGFHLTVQERLRQPAVSSRAKSRDLACGTRYPTSRGPSTSPRMTNVRVVQRCAAIGTLCGVTSFSPNAPGTAETFQAVWAQFRRMCSTNRKSDCIQCLSRWLAPSSNHTDSPLRLDSETDLGDKSRRRRSRRLPASLKLLDSFSCHHLVWRDFCPDLLIAVGRGLRRHQRNFS